MEQLMAEIHNVNGLKANQNLSYEEKQKLIEEKIRIYVAEQKANAYESGIRNSMNAVKTLLH